MQVKIKFKYKTFIFIGKTRVPIKKEVDVQIESKTLRAIHSMAKKQQKYKDRWAERTERADIIGMEITDHAWNRPKCKNALLIQSLIVEDCADTALRNIERREQRKKLYEAIRQLPEDQRKRILMYYFKELTVAEIAKIEGISTVAVYKSLESARRKIVNKL